MVGGALASYRIVGPIGEGGMGVVYRAEHVLLGRPAAVKVLLPEFSRNQEIVNRFFNEARAATAIRHPGIVEIYDFGYHADGSAYIVMELLDGESLARRLARVGRVAPDRAVSVARQIAGALSAAHAKGIIHRDLKPDNVFLVPDPEVPGGERIKLLDFGIAKLASDQPGSAHTRTGAVMGTPTYMAPEQCRGVPIDHRADLYSLGCILFEMVCGVPPFRGEGAGDVLAAHIHLAPPIPRAIAGDIPPSLDALILRLLAKPPDARPATAGHLVVEIDGLVWSAVPGGAAPRPAPSSPGPRIAATTLSGSTGVTAVTQRPARRSRTIAAAAGTVVIAGVAAMLLGRSGNTDQAPLAAAVAPSEPAATPPTAPPPAPAPQPAPVTEAASAPPARATVDIDLTSTPAGAEVLLDGAPLGRTPYRGEIPRAARATLLLRLSGYTDAKMTVSAESPIRKDVALKKKARVPTSRNPF